MKVRKAVIPAAGYGTRMLPITKAQPKEMVPVVHKPVIQYVVEEAYYSGIREILIITGKHKRAIEDHFDRSDLPKRDKYMEELDKILSDVNIYFVRQREQKGLGDAVRYAEAFVDDEPFALLLGDTITLPPCTKELIEVYRQYKTSIIAVEEVPKDKVSLYGIVACKPIEDSVYLIEDLVEKPSIEEAPSNLAILGRYILTPGIFECLKETKPGRGGEIQLTDAMRLLNKREKMYAYLFKGKRYDIGNKVDWLKANIELALEDGELAGEIKNYIRSLEVSLRT
ncbi:UTP--glucose-1-phosphate uridylyltransferase GalU [Archaeoglobus sp.]